MFIISLSCVSQLKFLNKLINYKYPVCQIGKNRIAYEILMYSSPSFSTYQLVVSCVSCLLPSTYTVVFVFFFFFNFIYGCAGSSLLCGLFFSLVAESGGCSVVAMHGLLIAVASPVAKHGL